MHPPLSFASTAPVCPAPAQYGIPDSLFPAERLGGLLDVLSDGTVSNQTAKAVLREMVLVRAPS